MSSSDDEFPDYCSVCFEEVDRTSDYDTGYKKGIPFTTHAGKCANTWKLNWPERYPQTKPLD